MRLFLDANILFTAAHNPDGRSAGLFRLARVGRCTLQTSPHALEEARRNLRVKHPEALALFEPLLERVSLRPEAPATLVEWALEQGLPPKDAPILASAVEARAHILVTGDRTHFGFLFGRRLRGVEVLAPRDALARLLE